MGGSESIAGSLVDDEATFGYCQNDVWYKMNLATLRALVGGAGGALSLTKLAVHEYRDIWAEERLNPNTSTPQWSFGDGTTGFVGLVIDAGWEVEAMYFHADVFPVTGQISVDLMNYGGTPTNAAVNTLANIALVNAADGGGQTNNAFKYKKLTAPVAVPTAVSGATVIGFTTRSFSGPISNMRVGARLRRKVGDFVTNVTLT